MLERIRCRAVYLNGFFSYATTEKKDDILDRYVGASANKTPKIKIKDCRVTVYDT